MYNTRAIAEDDVKRLIRSVKRNWELTQFPGVTTALNYIEGGLTGIRTVEPPYPRWISTKKKPPDDPESEVLVIVNGIYNNCKFIGAYLMGWYDEDEGWTIEGYEDWEDPEVLYWMPIPELQEE